VEHIRRLLPPPPKDEPPPRAGPSRAIPPQDEPPRAPPFRAPPSRLPPAAAEEPEETELPPPRAASVPRMEQRAAYARHVQRHGYKANK
jgi:hypothetical protein